MFFSFACLFVCLFFKHVGSIIALLYPGLSKVLKEFMFQEPFCGVSVQDTNLITAARSTSCSLYAGQ